MSFFGLFAFIYLLVLVAVCIRIPVVTQQSNKAMAYLLLAFFLPAMGILIYLMFGVNYWKKKRYNRKLEMDRALLGLLRKNVVHYDSSSIAALDPSVQQHAELASMVIRDLGSPLTKGNSVKMFINGEQKFPDMLEAIRGAKHHIHLEYYIYEYDDIGTELIELLIEKARQGVEVRMIYDDFGSPTLKKNTERRMREAGVEVYPFHKVLFYLLANRINYRNHRKIVVIDGCIGYLGGINVSDRYINNGKHRLFWRDTHMRVDGPAVYYLQYLFITDWNFCCPRQLEPSLQYFPPEMRIKENNFVQITASGPDSVLPSVLYSILQAIYLAKKEILITTPYFIPGDSIMDALCVAAQSGLSVKLLVPGISDSRIVNAAAKSYYNKLLEAGVEIYLYQKGFIHAKTMVTDALLSMVGTANMDYRSFEFNFEVNALIYDAEIAREVRATFFRDLEDSIQINRQEWLARPWYKQLPEKVARLLSPVM